MLIHCLPIKMEAGVKNSDAPKGLVWEFEVGVFKIYPAVGVQRPAIWLTAYVTDFTDSPITGPPHQTAHHEEGDEKTTNKPTSKHGGSIPRRWDLGVRMALQKTQILRCLASTGLRARNFWDYSGDCPRRFRHLQKAESSLNLRVFASGATGRTREAGADDTPGHWFSDYGQQGARPIGSGGMQGVLPSGKQFPECGVRLYRTFPAHGFHGIIARLVVTPHRAFAKSS